MSQLDPDPRDWIVKEQILQDPVSGLTLQFEVIETDPGDRAYQLSVFGNFPLGNHEFIFDSEGQQTGAGTALRDAPRPVTS